MKNTKIIGVSAMFAGLTGFLYSSSFLIITKNNSRFIVLVASFFLLLTGLLVLKLQVFLYNLYRKRHPNVALYGLILGVIASLGAIVHGGYDLSNAVNPPDNNIVSLANLPNQFDPRGLLTFGLSGIAIIVISYMIYKSGYFSKNLSYLGITLGLASIFLYFSRLTILNPNSNLIMVLAGITGFVLAPLWYTWLGYEIYEKKKDTLE